MKRTFPGTMMLALLILPVSAQRVELVVSAAASLTDVLTALARDSEQALGARVLFNFGGSGTLRRQIEQGAPVDVFVSAAAADMDSLQQQGLIVAASRRDLLSNSLVLIGTPRHEPVAGPQALRSLFSGSSLVAVGNPDAVPAGRYAMEALEHYGLAEMLRGRLVLGGSVREVLTYVASGAAPLGIVFLTDAVAEEPKGMVRRLFVFPPEATRTPIVYPVAVLARTTHPAESDRFARFLQSPQARVVFAKAGFVLP